MTGTTEQQQIAVQDRAFKAMEAKLGQVYGYVMKLESFIAVNETEKDILKQKILSLEEEKESLKKQIESLKCPVCSELPKEECLEPECPTIQTTKSKKENK